MKLAMTMTIVQAAANARNDETRREAAYRRHAPGSSSRRKTRLRRLVTRAPLRLPRTSAPRSGRSAPTG
jgi:hypothetical protein